MFASVTGTALDESNVRKAFNRILDAAELHRRGPLIDDDLREIQMVVTQLALLVALPMALL